MSLLLRAALLGGIAYLITRSLSGNATSMRTSMDAAGSGSRGRLRNEPHPGENLWPTSESQQATATDNAGPSS